MQCSTAAASKSKKKMTTDRKLRFPLWAGLLIVGGLAPLCGASHAEADLTVRVDDDRVSVTARDVPLADVLSEVAAQYDLRLVQHVALDRHVTVNIVRRPLAATLDDILDGESYQLYQAVASDDMAEDAERIPGVLWVFSQGSAIAPAATAYLEAIILEGDVSERRQAIRELRRAGTIDAVQALSLALGDENDGIRDAALEALAAIGSDEAQAAIASAAAHDDPKMRADAAYAMAMADGSSAVEYLSLALYDDNPMVRSAAIESLGDIGDDAALVAIRRALQDPDPTVRERAVEVIDEINDDAAFRVLFPFE